MINDDELLLFHYDDGLSAMRREEIAAALAASAALRDRLAQLQAELRGMQQWPQPAPTAATQARWRAALQQRSSAPSRRAPPMLQWALACTLLLAGVGIGLRLAERSPVDLPAVAAVEGKPALVRGVRAHLGDTRQLLANWDASAPEQRDALLADVLAQNRSYIAAAERVGDQRLARVLRAFEPVLLQLAQPESGGRLDGTRAQLDFELGAMQTKLSRTPSNGAQRL